MSGILSAPPRSLGRCIFKIIKYSERKVHQVPIKYRAFSQGFNVTKTGFSILKDQQSFRSNKILCCCQVEYFRTSAASFATTVVKVPTFADSVSEGDLRWEKKKGDIVNEDEVVAEIETDKTSVPVPAPCTGVIEELLVADGTTVKAGQDLFKITPTEGGAPPRVKEAPAVKQQPAAAPPPGAPAPPPGRAPPARAPPASAPPPAAAPPPTPPRRAGPTSPNFRPLSEAEDGPPDPPLPRQRPVSIETPQIDPHDPKIYAERIKAAGQARQAAPITSIPVAAIRHAQAIEAATVRLPPQDPTKEISGTRTEQRVKMNRMRMRIAERLKEAQNVNAMLTTFNEIDMSAIMDFRKAHLEGFQKKYNLKLGFMSAFVKASAYALQDQPVVNAVIEGNEIIYRDYVDISVAVATPKGLVVPVIRNVEHMSYADIEIAINSLGERARQGALAVEDMDGGTFTISNGGVFGSLMGTPIINPPQSAILGMHAIFERPVAIKGQVVIKPMMYVALTYDHRLVDGREAVMFLRKIKGAVEDPRIILAGL